MKKQLQLVALAALFSVFSLIPENAFAQDDAFGLGIIVGEPTGISAKKWLNSNNAVDGAVAWSVNKNARFQIHADYLYHRSYLLSADHTNDTIPVYFGLGARMRFAENGDDVIGVRFPVGLAGMLGNSPFEAFVEIVPIMDLAPATDFDLNGAIGLRFWFTQR